MATAAKDEKFTFFWKKDSPFSQWYPIKFTVDGILYNCAEQYMMHRKAALFGDHETAIKILETQKPAQQKSLGRKVKYFDEDVWTASCIGIVKAGNKAKFSQHAGLRKALFDTRGTTLVEASPVDTIWGIGLAADSQDAQNKATWRGQNLLGYVLTEVRDELLRDPKFEAEVKSSKNDHMTTAEIEAGIKSLLFSKKTKTSPSKLASKSTLPHVPKKEPSTVDSINESLGHDAGKGPPWPDNSVPSHPVSAKRQANRVQDKHMQNATIQNMVQRDLQILTKASLTAGSAPSTSRDRQNADRHEPALIEPASRKRKNRGKKKGKGTPSPTKEIPQKGKKVVSDKDDIQKLQVANVQNPLASGTSGSAPPVKSRSVSPKKHASESAPGKRSPTPQLSDKDDTDSATLARLETEFLFPLKKKSLKFQNAKFFCRLCEYHCDTVAHCNRHIRDNRHKRLKSIKQTDTFLRSLPLPSPAHIRSVEKTVNKTYTERGLSEQDLTTRNQAAQFLRSTIASKVEGVELVMYGSSLTGIGLKDSDLNLDVTGPDSPKSLQKIHLLLKNDDSGNFSDVRSDFNCKVPSVYLRLPNFNNVQVQISINNAACCKTSQLLAVYAALDPRVAKLGAIFRYWAKICEIDQQHAGTLTAYVYSLLTVYFLQQCPQPLLPVLHELVEVDPKQPGSEHCYLSDVSLIKKKWKTRNTCSVGELWISLLRFYTIGFDSASLVVCVRQLAKLQRSEKKWSSKKLAIEDPFQRRRNVAHTVSHMQVFEFINDRFLAAYQYFGVPQGVKGPLYTDIIDLKKARCLQEQPSKPRPSPPTSVCENTDRVTETSRVSDCKDINTTSLTNTNCCSGGTKDTHSKSCASCADPGGRVLSDLSESCGGSSSTDCSATCESSTCQTYETDNSQTDNTESRDAGVKSKSSIQDDQTISLHFELSARVLADSKGPLVFCSVCQKEGHLKQVCPDENLPPVPPLPPMTPAFKKRLDSILKNVPRDFEPRERELSIREMVLHELQSYVREIYPDAMLSLFGSSCNGFGFQHSDLDICLTFKSMPSGKEEGLDHAEMMNSLAKCLKRHQGLYHVLPITTAKVPIVKFRHGRSQLEGDISLYNTLAQHNTRLLLKYCEFDSRVKALGYTMKVLAKCCEICDASRGSLSSYAYILMVIYFLQQRKPPVLPVLQELYEGKNKPHRPVDGCNAWFQEDLNVVRRLWKQPVNSESVSELWNGLLQFYTDEFNMKDYVISIRQLEPLSKFEKIWNSKCICIEDPFDLNHNLGSGLSRKMNIYIMKALRNARTLFGTPVDEVPRGYKTMQDYLFDVRMLTDGSPPNDRGCRICGKIGHFMKECPVTLAKKARKDRDDKDREESEEDTQNDEADSSVTPSTPKSKHQGSQPVPIPGVLHRSLSTGHTPIMNESHGSPITALRHSQSSPGGHSGFSMINHHTPPHGAIFFSPTGSPCGATPPAASVYYPTPQQVPQPAEGLRKGSMSQSQAATNMPVPHTPANPKTSVLQHQDGASPRSISNQSSVTYTSRNSPSGRLPSGGSQTSSSKPKIGSGRLAKNY